MRSELHMKNLILDCANSSDLIRAVILNGSRVNPNAPQDIFQDFDIIYIVSDIDHFTNDHCWIDYFGERIITQTPEDMIYPPPLNNGTFSYLMQFTDGNRLDLTLYPLDRLNQLKLESLSLIWLDKDKLFSDIPPASDKDNTPSKPSYKEFSDCCNEFWWVSTYVAKGLWRQEIPYAQHMLQQVLRAPLNKMLDWLIAEQNGYRCGSGKHGKYLQNHLSSKHWKLVEQTYCGAQIDDIWASLYAMCDLFREAAHLVAKSNSFTYNLDEDQKVATHLHYVDNLPSTAKDMYPNSNECNNYITNKSLDSN